MALLWNPDSWTQRLAEDLRLQLASLTAEREELMVQPEA
jgi:hypothetical protein